MNINSELFNICIEPTIDQNEAMDELIQHQFGTQEELEQLIVEQEQLEQEVHDLNEEIEKLNSIPEHVAEGQKDLQRFEEYLAKMQSHIQSHEEQLEQLRKDFEEKSNICKEVKGKRNELISQINDQDFGVDDLELARNRKDIFEDEIKKEENSIEELKKTIRTCKLELTKGDDALSSLRNDAAAWLSNLNSSVSTHSISEYISSVKAVLQSKATTDLIDYFSSNQSIAENKAIRDLFSNHVHLIKCSVLEQLEALDGVMKTNEIQKINEVDIQLNDREETNQKLKNEVDELNSRLKELREVSN